VLGTVVARGIVGWRLVEVHDDLFHVFNS
jgi:hypothetical protein